MQVRAHTENACVVYRFEGGVSAWTIEKSVGVGGFNRKDDVLKIQQLLNKIAPGDGGPLPPLAEDGLAGPKTNGAIRAFQQFHRVASDGRVDPGGPTLKRMNEVPKQGLAAQNAARLARTAQLQQAQLVGYQFLKGEPLPVAIVARCNGRQIGFGRW